MISSRKIIATSLSIVVSISLVFGDAFARSSESSPAMSSDDGIKVGWAYRLKKDSTLRIVRFVKRNGYDADALFLLKGSEFDVVNRRVDEKDGEMLRIRIFTDDTESDLPSDLWISAENLKASDLELAVLESQDDEGEDEEFAELVQISDDEVLEADWMETESAAIRGSKARKGKKTGHGRRHGRRRGKPMTYCLGGVRQILQEKNICEAHLGGVASLAYDDLLSEEKCGMVSSEKDEDFLRTDFNELPMYSVCVSTGGRPCCIAKNKRGKCINSVGCGHAAVKVKEDGEKQWAFGNKKIKRRGRLMGYTIKYVDSPWLNGPGRGIKGCAVPKDSSI